MAQPQPGHPLILYDRQRRRLWICGRRCHHGLVCAAVAAIALIGVYHDRKDWPWPLEKVSL
jgi:hypothetical protein